ncbi:unnamed protein product, partial [Allacma fusca]
MTHDLPKGPVLIQDRDVGKRDAEDRHEQVPQSEVRNE